MEGWWPLQGLAGHVRAFCPCANNYRKHRDESNLHSDFGVVERLQRVSMDTGSPERRPLPWSVGSVGEGARRWPHGT